MFRKLKIIYELNQSTKLKLRKFIKTELGLSSNAKLTTLIKQTKVKTEKQFYKLVKNKYNDYVEQENEKIENKKKENRSIKSYETRIKKQINTLTSKKIFKNINENKLKILVRLLNNTNSKYLIHNGTKTYTLSDDFIKDITDYEPLSSSHGSDRVVVDYVNNYSKIEIEKINHNEKHKNGGFFKYEHRLVGLDLSVLQIYEDFKPEYYTENCFIKSLIGQVSDKVINDCKMSIKGKDTTLKNIS